MEERDVVTCVLRHGPEVLLVRRSEAVGTYAGRWGTVSGDADGDPDDAARRAIDEAVGLLEAVDLVRSAAPLDVRDDGLGVRWRVHPYLFDCESTAVEPSEERAGHEWVQPPAMLDRETVPALWATYRAVAPTVETVREDSAHGSAYVSLRALEVLRDGATDVAERGGEFETVAALARDLRAARPGMGVVATRIDRAMAAAIDRTPASVRDATVDACKRAVRADAEAAANAAGVVGERVLTLSRSGTVLEALRQSAPGAVFVAESQPAREGVGVAEELADEGFDVSLFVDAAIGHVLAECDVDTVLVGADSVLADGSVVNKVGTRLAALAAFDTGIDCYAVCARDKIVPETDPALESGSRTAVYDGEAAIRIHDPTFEAVPADLFDGVVTESGVLSRPALEATADEHAAFADWDR